MPLGASPARSPHAVFTSARINACRHKSEGQAVLGRQSLVSTPWLTERHGSVPTCDLTRSLSTTGMRGVNIATDAFGRIACPLPARRFHQRPDQRLQTRHIQHQSGPSPRNGLSLSRNGCASRRLHPGVNVPGLPLRILTGFRPARSALWLHARSRFAPAPTVSTPRTRCRISTDQHWPFRKPPLPFGRITSLRINAFISVQPVGPPAEFARFPFAPRRHRLMKDCRLRINVPGSLRFRRLAVPSRRPSGLRKTKSRVNSLAHRTTWLRSVFTQWPRLPNSPDSRSLPAAIV